ncbi:MAG: HD-GYP domain-containing protein [Actinomycetota bacterium]
MEKREGPGLRILVAGLHRTITESLGRVVGDLAGAEVTVAAASSAEAIELAGKFAPDLALIDLELSPNCSLVAGLRALCPDTRVIVLAERGGGDAFALVKALASGAVGAIYKEASLEDLARVLRRSSTTTPVVPEEAVGLLLGSYLDALTEKRGRDFAVIEALAAAVEVRDLATGAHLGRVARLASACMERVDASLAKNEEVSYGFTLHDIGKIGVPDAILNKPGPLSSDEWEIMRRHPEIGTKIVEPIGFPSSTTEVILCHHERWDGGGYPHGLRRDEIPISARVFSVSDAYDAMTSDRPYREAMPHEAALSLIQGEARRAFDPDVVDAFLGLTNGSRLP